MSCTDLFRGFLVTPFLRQKGESVSGRADSSFHSLLHKPHGSPRLTAGPSPSSSPSLALSLWADFIVGSQKPLKAGYYTSTHNRHYPQGFAPLLPGLVPVCHQEEAESLYSPYSSVPLGTSVRSLGAQTEEGWGTLEH